MSTQMEHWLEMQNPKLQSSVTPIVATEPLLHLSSSFNIKTFTPRIPVSLYDGEDQTVPRVSVSSNIMDTIVGGSWNFEELATTINHRERDYVVYGLEADEVIRPTKKLTKEALATGELWVVPHKLSMYEIKPLHMLYLTLSSITNVGNSIRLGFVLDVRVPTQLTPTKRISEGYYLLTGLSLSRILNKHRDVEYDLCAISRDGYLKGKQELVVLQ